MKTKASRDGEATRSRSDTVLGFFSAIYPCQERLLLKSMGRSVLQRGDYCNCVSSSNRSTNEE